MTDLGYERIAAWQTDVRMDLLCAALELVWESSECATDEKTAWHWRITRRPWYQPINSADYFGARGIRYLGELLERHAEKFGDEKPIYRAVALALGYAQPMITEAMFAVGQYRAFMRRLRKDAAGDLYLQCALYLIEPDRRGELSSALFARAYTSAAEIIFVLEILQEDAYAALRQQLLTALGGTRVMPVYGNAGIYGALIRTHSEAIQACRKKDNALLRALLPLCTEYVREGSRADTVLKEAGYTRREVLYLNAALLCENPLGTAIHRKSIPAEKLAVDYTVTFLNSEEAPSPEAFAFLENLLAFYKRFYIKIEGYPGLWEAVQSLIKPVSPVVLAWIVQHIEGKSCHYAFDVLDGKWDALARLLPFEQYHKLFREQLEEQAACESIPAMLERYQALTARNYLDVFNHYSYREQKAFSMLADAGVLSLWEYFQAHCNEEDKECLEYIERYASAISTRKAYDFWETLFSALPMDKLNAYFGKHYKFHSSLLTLPSRSFYRNKEQLSIQRDFLTLKEQRQLYEWIDASVFCTEPERYTDFLAFALEDGTVRVLFSAEELRAVFEGLLCSAPNKVDKQLKMLYYTDVEKEAEQRVEEEQKRREKQQEAEERIQECLQRLEEKFDGTLASLTDACRFCKWRQEATMARLALPKALDLLERHGDSLNHKEIESLLSLIEFFYKNKAVSYDGLKQILISIKEETLDDGGTAT